MLNTQTALLDCRQMAEADRLTVAAGTSGVMLMENAGAAVARAIAERWLPRPVTILCGPDHAS
jgi:NAD(P)H-hydrate epimerase